MILIKAVTYKAITTNRRQYGHISSDAGSNKRAITLNLKTEQGREIPKKLVAPPMCWSNYRPRHSRLWALATKTRRRSIRN